jgi:uncharacterized membrane protein
VWSTEVRNPKSTATIVGHPIHPMLVTVADRAVHCDAYLRSRVLARRRQWLGHGSDLAARRRRAAAAAVAGLVDLLSDQQIYSMTDAWWHAGGNVLLLLIELYSWYARHTEGAAAVVPKGPILSIVAVALLLFTGWKGGELVYHHRVGVQDDPEAPRAVAGPRRAA